MRISLVLMGACLALAVGACGDDDDEVGASPPGGPDLQARMQVGEAGGSHWRSALEVRPGDTVRFRVALFNGGGAQARDIVVAGRLPRGLRPVNGGPMVYDLGVDAANGHPVDEGFFADGLELGPMSVHDSRFLEFDARVTGRAQGRLTNVATVASASGRASASAALLVRSR